LGGLLTAGALGAVVHCARLFRKAGTYIEPWRKTSSIVTSGLYRWSRNPIYLSFVIAGLGVACLLNDFWIVLMQIPLATVLTKMVIEKEERYLEDKFGESYRAYKKKVRRWL